MYLGQYREGDEVVVSVRAYESTPPTGTFPFAESNPEVRIFRTGSTVELVEGPFQLAAYESPFFPGYFRLPIFLNALYEPTGSYTAEVRWKSTAVNNQIITRYCPFEILPGGSADGMITSLAEVVRPDKRFLMCGTTAGRILRRKNPRVAQ